MWNYITKQYISMSAKHPDLVNDVMIVLALCVNHSRVCCIDNKGFCYCLDSLFPFLNTYC